MITTELANAFRAISEQRKQLQSLAPVLRSDLSVPLNQLLDGYKDLAALAQVLEQFPGQSVAETMKGVVALLQKERKSVPRLKIRLQQFRQQAGEEEESLRQDLKSLSVTELKSLLKDLGSKADNKQQALDLLDKYMQGEDLPDPNTAKIQTVFENFQGIYNDIPNLSIAEIRNRFEPIRREPKAILEGLANKLERQFRGTKTEIADQLLGILEGVKGSQVQTELIGSGQE